MSEKANSSTLQVIGAGFGRTGTSSLKKALEILGYPCYHMDEVFEHGDHKFWSKVSDNHTFDFDEVFAKPGFKASSDFPSAIYWRQQLKQYPTAKVILTVRDPEKWYKSCSDSIFCFMPDGPFSKWGIMIRQILRSTHDREMYLKTIKRDAFNNDWSKENVINSFIRHNANVVNECAPAQLLVYEVSQGWEPLCKFLNKPVPSVPFPNVNDTAAFKQHIVEANRAGLAMATSILVPVVMLAVGAIFGSSS